MCDSCWVERGSPIIDTPQVRAAAALLVRLDDEVPMRGGMHAQLDDWNIDDVHFSGDPKADLAPLPSVYSLDARQQALVMETHAAMCALTEQERASALALEDGYWT